MIRMADPGTAAGGNGRHRAVELAHSADPWDRLFRPLGVALLGLGLFAAVNGTVSLVAHDDVELGNAVRGYGLLVVTFAVVGVSLWINRKRKSS